jgi:hypothetical protein
MTADQVDIDVIIPAAREKLLKLCALHADARDEKTRGQYLKSIEAAALNMGYVFAIELINFGWKPQVSDVVLICDRVLSEHV